MSDKRFKIIYTEGETFNKDTEFCFDCENEEQLENIIQIALVSPNQINYIFDEELLNTYLITYSKKYNL